MPARTRRIAAVLLAALLVAGVVATSPLTTQPTAAAAASTLGLTGSATASSSESAATGPANALDGDLSTGWRAASTTSPQWLRVDLGKPYALHSVRQTFDADGVWGFVVEGSLDSQAWVPLVDKRHRLAGRTFAETVSGLYRHVRLTVTAAPAGRRASSQELVIGGTDQGTNLAAGRTATSSTSLPNYPAANAIDGSDSTYWAAGNHTSRSG